MSNALVAAILRQRELTIEIGKWKFHARRPTDVQAVEIHNKKAAYSEMSRQFVIGWENVVEDDIIGGGGQDPVKFTPELWAEWCADRPDFWAPIAGRLLEAYSQHAQTLELAGKNSPPG